MYVVVKYRWFRRIPGRFWAFWYGFVQQFVQHFEVSILSVRGVDFFSSCADSAALSGAAVVIDSPIYCSCGMGVEGDGDETRRPQGHL